MTNNDTLRALKLKHGLTYQNLAETLSVSLYTVQSWLIHDKSEKYRNVTDHRMDSIMVKLKKAGYS